MLSETTATFVSLPCSRYFLSPCPAPPSISSVLPNRDSEWTTPIICLAGKGLHYRFSCAQGSVEGEMQLHMRQTLSFGCMAAPSHTKKKT